MVFHHIFDLKLDLGYKIVRFYRAQRRFYGEVFTLPRDFQVFSSQLIDGFFPIARTFLLPLKHVSAIFSKLFHSFGDIEGWQLFRHRYQYKSGLVQRLFQ